MAGENTTPLLHLRPVSTGADLRGPHAATRAERQCFGQLVLPRPV